MYYSGPVQIDDIYIYIYNYIYEKKKKKNDFL